MIDLQANTRCMYFVDHSHNFKSQHVSMEIATWHTRIHAYPLMRACTHTTCTHVYSKVQNCFFLPWFHFFKFRKIRVRICLSNCYSSNTGNAFENIVLNFNQLKLIMLKFYTSDNALILFKEEFSFNDKAVFVVLKWSTSFRLMD